MKREYKVLINVDEELVCSICSDVFYKPVKTDCGHIFCGKCLINWLKVKWTCPICRKHVSGYIGDYRIAKRAEKTKIECLRCLEWQGELGQFKCHRAKNCKIKNQEQQITQPCIEIVDNDVVEPKRVKKVQIDRAQFQQNQLILRFYQLTTEIANQMFYNSLSLDGSEQQCDTENAFDESIQFMNESEIKEFKHSKKYLLKLIEQFNELNKEIMKNIATGDVQDLSFISTIQLTYGYLSGLQIQLKN